MIKEYIKEAYPYGIRKEADVEGSLTDKYDEVRSTVFDLISTDINSAAKEVVITTATDIGISEWELFLRIPKDPSRTLEERRSYVLSRVFGGNATLSILKTIVYSLVGGDETNVVFYEKWTTGTAVGDEVFGYEVRINAGAVSRSFSPEAIDATLQLLHPAHCNVTLLTNYSPFSWVEEASPGSNPYHWVDESYPYEGSYWS